jgi:hypothetical protein
MTESVTLLMQVSSGKMMHSLLLPALVMLTLLISPIVSQDPTALTAAGTNALGISCQAYCVGINGAPYDASIPSDWDGAYCVNTSRTSGGVPYMQVPCSAVYSDWGEALLCTCAPSDQGRDGQGLGWNQVGYASEGERACLPLLG